MRKVAILVDGAFYLKRHKKFFGNKVFKDVVKDLQSHCLKHINPKKDKNTDEFLYRIFFYDCSPLSRKQHNPITKESVDFSKTTTAIFRNELHQALRKTRNFALRLGKLDEKNARWKIKDPKIERKVIAGEIKATADDLIYSARQKTVDMKIGLDIAAISYKKLADKIILISGDSDFVPTAKLARIEGVEFILDSMGATIKPELQEHIDGLNTTLPKKNPNNLC